MTKSDILRSTSIGQLAIEDSRRLIVLKKYYFDYCCEGDSSLEDACQSKGLEVNDVIDELEAASLTPPKSKDQFHEWGLRELIEYIKNFHHQYVRDALPVLVELSQKVAAKHQGNHPELVEIARIIGQVAEELQAHMMKEERILFPYVLYMAQNKERGQLTESPHFGSVANPIEMMELEHKNAGSALKRLSNLTGGYNIPGDACNSFKALYSMLKEFEEDLHQHIHLENNLLFPKAIAMEEGADN